MSLLREIQNDLSRPEVDVPTVLRKCKILAARLGSKEFSQWIEWELNGYPDDQATPDYRHLNTRCAANFMNRVWRYDDQPVLMGLFPEAIQQKLQTVDFSQGIAKVQPFIKDGARIERPDLALQLQGKMYPQMQCVAAWQQITSAELLQLLSAIQTRLLDFVLSIEAENPAAGEAAINSQPVSPEKVLSLVNNFYGSVGNVAQHSQHFSQTAHFGISSQDLSRLVTEFSKHLDELKLDSTQKRRAEAQLATLKVEVEGVPDAVIVKQAAHTLRNITEGAVASLIAAAAQPTIWQWIHDALIAITLSGHP